MTAIPQPLRVRVAAKTAAATDICSYELVAADGAPLPPFTAGAHIDVAIRPGLTRQYSLCNDPSEQHRYRIAVLRDANSRGGSQAMHEQVNAGDVLAISAPRNHFPLVAGARRSLLLAGGIGITPVVAMAQHLSAEGEAFHLHYFARSRQRAVFSTQLQASPFARDISLHLDDEAPARPDLRALLGTPEAGTHLYVCGPKAFIDAVLAAARANGWAEEHLHFELFGAAVVRSAADRGFQVKLARSGRLVPVAGDQTVVEALADAGVAIPTSCEQGICGTCLTSVLDGEPDHLDSFLTPEEQARNDQFLPCCSRAKSALLVLDL